MQKKNSASKAGIRAEDMMPKGLSITQRAQQNGRKHTIVNICLTILQQYFLLHLN